MHSSQYVTNQSDAQIPVRSLLLCTNPSTDPSMQFTPLHESKYMTNSTATL